MPNELLLTTNSSYISKEEEKEKVNVTINNEDDFAAMKSVLNTEREEELSKLKIKNALSTNPDIILTACPACVAGLTQGMFYTKKTTKTPKIMNMTEFLALANPYL